MATLTAKEPGATYSVVKARKPHHCYFNTATYPRLCRRTIDPGQQYVRAVMFPNHDIYSYVDGIGKPLRRPIVQDLCFECAAESHTTGMLVIAAEREDRAK